MSSVAAILLLVVVVAGAGGGIYALQSGMFSFDSQKSGDQTPQVTETPIVQEPQETPKTQQVTSFEECAAAGNPILESYPRRCKSGDAFFTEEVVMNETRAGEEVEGTKVDGRVNTVESFKAKPTLCEFDSDCKIIPITCNNCDCGRAVNNWIEPYACTAEDKADPCPVALSCKPSKAICDAGVCKKVDA